MVARWNPQGAALLTAVRGAGAAAKVALIGPDDANTALLRTELARFEPRADLTEPMSDITAHRPVGGTPTRHETTTAASGAPSVRPEAIWGASGAPLPRPEATAGAPLMRPDATAGPPGTPLLRSEASSGVVGVPVPVALILLDAGSALGADTLRLLTGLRGEGTRVLLAMNGIHAYADWRSVRERNLELLAVHGLGEADLFAVSARLAAAARASGDPALLDRSGLSALHAALTAAAGAAAGDPHRQAILTGRVLAETRERIAAQVSTLRSGAETTRLRAERAELIAGRDSGRATAMSTLRGHLHLARVDLLTEVGGQVRALHVAARAELDRLPPAEFEDYPARLQHAVTELTGAVDQGIDRRFADLLTRLAATDVGAITVPQRRRDPAPRVGPEPEPRHRGVEDHLMIALGASAGVGLGRLLVSPLALVPALDVASIPVTLLLGALVAWWVVRARRQVADRAHVRQWLAEALVNVKAQLEQRVATALVGAETEWSDRVVRASAARILDTDRRVAELETRIRRAVAEQPAQLAACERDIAVIDRFG
ncbi:hypothetical protein ACTD5D_03695 [Nocardia takedensis]|uniref:hypothetical protein n=1 Tax=Nocardia takedensis TaxID=259390 RepID=UPI0002FB5100|nr:hypothetical protein [Nocardia takedensis]